VLKKDPESLIAALGSTDPREREKAANALISVADPRAEEPLIEALSDVEPRVRVMAALAIGSLGSRRAVPKLLELTQDPDWLVRVAALNGLGYIDQALPAEPALGALGDEEPLVRETAALNMGGSTEPAAVDVLVEALLRDPDLAVREAAAEALGEIGDARATKAPPGGAFLAGGRQLARRPSSPPGTSTDRGGPRQEGLTRPARRSPRQDPARVEQAVHLREP
jgi:HEAT repeat protein